jgi:hypothetical protein
MLLLNRKNKKYNYLVCKVLTHDFLNGGIQVMIINCLNLLL